MYIQSALTINRCESFRDRSLVTYFSFLFAIDHVFLINLAGLYACMLATIPQNLGEKEQ